PSNATPGSSGATAPDSFLLLAPSKGKGKAPPLQDVNMEGAAPVAAPAPTSRHSLVKSKPACDLAPSKPSSGEYAPPPVASIRPPPPPVKHMTCPRGPSPLYALATRWRPTTQPVAPPSKAPAPRPA